MLWVEKLKTPFEFIHEWSFKSTKPLILVPFLFFLLIRGSAFNLNFHGFYSEHQTVRFDLFILKVNSWVQIMHFLTRMPIYIMYRLCFSCVYLLFICMVLMCIFVWIVMLSDLFVWFLCVNVRRRQNAAATGVESSILGKNQPPQLRSQQSQQSFSQGSQHGFFSQLSQNSPDDVITNDQVKSLSFPLWLCVCTHNEEV